MSFRDLKAWAKLNADIVRAYGAKQPDARTAAEKILPIRASGPQFGEMLHPDDTAAIDEWGHAG